jgi:D-galacturonate reductase
VSRDGARAGGGRDGGRARVRERGAGARALSLERRRRPPSQRPRDTTLSQPEKNNPTPLNHSFVQTAHGPASDKPAGVVALSCLELRAQGRVGRLVLVDRSGSRMPLVRQTLQRNIGDAYVGLDPSVIETLPEDHVQDDPDAYLKAMALMRPGDACIIFTPDDTHAAIASAALRHGLHVLVAKPAVRTLAEHRALAALARAGGKGEGEEEGGGGGEAVAGNGRAAAAAAGTANGNDHDRTTGRPLLIATEYHKRFDPVYSDARARASKLGPFSYYYSYMAQPKQQLDTFRGWAGKSSDISFYLNSHHVDVHCWLVGGRGRPVRVSAAASERAYAAARLGRPCEDTITLTATWENDAVEEGGGDGATAAAATAAGNTATPVKSTGIAVYTASWVAPKGECHTRQHFHYIGREGELHADQAHRGYSTATDAAGFASLNPLYMRYTPDARGRFAGQAGYGFQSIARFLEAAARVARGELSVADVRDEGALALLDAPGSAAVTAILQAGRLSLDRGGVGVLIRYDDRGEPVAVEVEGE